jgi:hypothetical protein
VDSKLVLHTGAKPVSREQLARVACPDGTDTWKPVPHLTVLDLISTMLGHAGFQIDKEQLGLTRDEHRFFGTLDLRNELAAGVNLSVGIRNSTDQSLPLGFCAGNRVFVCDNLAFSSELIVRRKHTKNGELRFREAISLAVQDLTQFHRAETRRIEFMQETSLCPYEAEAFLIAAFEQGLLSARTLRQAIAAYRKPAFDWGPQDRVWHLFNAMSLSMQPRAKSNPQQFALTTMRLMAMLGPKVGFDAPPDIVLEPDRYEFSTGEVDANAFAEGERPDDFPVTF